MAIIEHSGYYENPLSGVSHEHTSCELMYVLEGELEITVKNKKHHIFKNSLVLIKSRQHHKVRFISDGEYHRYIAMINPWELRKQLVRPDLFALLTDISESGIVVVYNALNLINEFEKMTDIFNNGANVYAELSAALQVISVLYEEVKPRRESRSESTANQEAREEAVHRYEFDEVFYETLIKITTENERNEKWTKP